jgi:hypothetical protein
MLKVVVGLATACSVFATSPSARADDMSAAGHRPAAWAQWQTGLTDAGYTAAKPVWTSTLSAIDPDDFEALRRMHGTVGLCNPAREGSGLALGALAAPRGIH